MVWLIKLVIGYGCFTYVNIDQIYYIILLHTQKKKREKWV